MNKTNKIYTSLLAISLVSFGVLVAQVNAETFQVSGNGTGSNNSIQINQTNNTNVNQTNQANVSNDVNINSNTGGNSINGGVGDGSIKTGDINNNVEINNQFNTNNATVSCKNCATPTPKPLKDPSPTTKPGVGGNGGGTSGGSSSGGAGGSSSGGQILGLPTTSGENELASLLKLLPAFGSLFVGFSLLRKNA